LGFTHEVVARRDPGVPGWLATAVTIAAARHQDDDFASLAAR
jgi:hypothetical protein